MTASALLEPTLNQILAAVKPSSEATRIRNQVIDSFGSVVQQVEGLRGATVEPFGSFVSKLFSRWGDLDISIELPNDSFVSTATRKRKQSLLRALFRALQARADFHEVKLISSARVPIIKFKTRYQNISCDISMDNLIGKMKSKFLGWISGIDERFQDMVLLVKEWAKAHDINDSCSGSLNSYSLTLLVVYHFQTCVPVILPPLKEIYPGCIADDLTGFRADAENRIRETCASNIARFKSDRFRTRNRSSLSELFISFLEKYRNIDTMAMDRGMCLQNGKWDFINRNMGWSEKSYVLLIEDPFERPENAARAVNRTQLSRITDVITRTYWDLISQYATQDSLIASLVGPQAARLIPRALTDLSEFPMLSTRTNLQPSRATYSSQHFTHPPYYR